MSIVNHFDYYEASYLAIQLMGALPNLNRRPPLEDAELRKLPEMIQDQWLPEIGHVIDDELIPFFEKDTLGAVRDSRRLAQKLNSMTKDQRVELYRAVHRLFWAEPDSSAFVSDDLFKAGFFDEGGLRQAKLWENYENRRKKWR